MSDDILGGFFSDIKAVEKEVTTVTEEVVSRPAKRQKTSNGSIIEKSVHSEPQKSINMSVTSRESASSTINAAPSASVTSVTSAATTAAPTVSANAPPTSSDLLAFLHAKAVPVVSLSSGNYRPANPDKTSATKGEPGHTRMTGVKTQADKEFVRTAAGEKWVDESLKDWPENDFRLFIGDLGKDTKEKELEQMFLEYKSYAMCRIAMNRFGGRSEPQSKGYGFVSFLDPLDAALAMREKDGKYLGDRPMKIKRADWMKRDAAQVKKDKKKKKKLLKDLGI
jgi:hypothetical protein